MVLIFVIALVLSGKLTEDNSSTPAFQIVPEGESFRYNH